MDSEQGSKEGSVKLSEVANEGFRDAEAYETHRPTYPHRAITSLLSHMNLLSLPSPKIIDLGAGTGKFTVLLAEILAAERRAGRDVEGGVEGDVDIVEGDEGYEILAVEPQREMRDVLRSVLRRKGLDGEGGNGEKGGNGGKVSGRVVVGEGWSGGIGVERGWGDGVVVAQAFHWFANEESLREIHRVLRPGGSLGLIWNIESYNSPQSWPSKSKWEESLKSLTWTFSDSHSRFRNLRWREVFESPSSSTGPFSNPLQTLKATFTTDEESGGKPLFGLPLGEEKVEWTTWLSEEALWNRYCTLSQVAVTKGEERERVRKRFEEIMTEVDDEKGERNEKGEVGVNGVTVFYWTSRV